MGEEVGFASDMLAMGSNWVFWSKHCGYQEREVRGGRTPTTSSRVRSSSVFSNIRGLFKMASALTLSMTWIDW